MFQVQCFKVSQFPSMGWWGSYSLFYYVLRYVILILVTRWHARTFY